MQLRWRRCMTNKSYVNTIKNRILRQLLALDLASGKYNNKKIISFDEANFIDAVGRRYSFERKGVVN